MPFDQRTLLLPADTQFGERVIVTKGDVVVADGCKVDFGFETPERVFVGEGAEIAGSITAGGDVRVDLFSEIAGDVTSGGSAYLGERARIGGKLRVEHDLDVANDVKIEKGFEAHGWINIRSPIPMVTFLFIYLLQLLQMGRSAEVEKILKEMEAVEDGAPIAVSDVFMFVPEGSRLLLQDAKVKGNLEAGEGCRLLGNYAVDGWARVGNMTKVLGALRAEGDVTLGDFVEVHGDLVATGAVVVGNGCHVYGKLEARAVEMRQTALVDGAIVAADGVRFVAPELVSVKEKADEVETVKAPDVLDLLG